SPPSPSPTSSPSAATRPGSSPPPPAAPPKSPPPRPTPPPPSPTTQKTPRPPPPPPTSTPPPTTTPPRPPPPPPPPPSTRPSARQLETVAVEGRTVLHVAGELPAFLTIATPAPDDIDSIVVTTEGDPPERDANQPTESSARIKKFIPKPRKVGTGFVTKPG